jgi:hypothetical protein
MNKNALWNCFQSIAAAIRPIPISLGALKMLKEANRCCHGLTAPGWAPGGYAVRAFPALLFIGSKLTNLELSAVARG